MSDYIRLKTRILGLFLLQVLAVCVLFSCGRKTQQNASDNTTGNAPVSLPRICFKTETGIPWDKRCPCVLVEKMNGDSVALNGKIKCRGGTSSKFEKYSYSLKLSDAYSLCGLPACKTWVLNASYIDKTFMRHKLCFDLFRMMDERNMAAQCAYAMLQLNQEPRGLYVVMQRLNEHVLALDKQDTNALIFKEPKLFYENLPPREPDQDNYHGQKYPDYDVYGDKSAVLDDFRQFILHSSDEEFAEGIGKWIDMRNVVDWHLLVLLANSGENIAKNLYLYKKDTETPFRVALWDCDHSFGRDGDNEMNLLERPARIQKNILLDRLSKNPEYQHAMAERYASLRKSGIFSYENIKKMVQENDQYVRLGIEENASIWPYDGKYYYDSNNYEEEVELLLKFVPLSLQRLDEMFDYR